MNKNELLNCVLAYELNMFLSVQEEGHSECRDYPDLFLINRRAQLSGYSADTLDSYLEDLSVADRSGENLIADKYAFMEGILKPSEEKKEFVEPLLEKFVGWQKDFKKRNEKILAKARPIENDEKSVVSFRHYFWGELNTYSLKTLKLLGRDVAEYEKNGINFSDLVYDELKRSKEKIHCEISEEEESAALDALVENEICPSCCCQLSESILEK